MSLKEKKVLVIGSNGFIGSHLIKRLKNEKAEIYCINRNKSKISGIKSYEINILDFNKLKKTIEGINPNIIFHLVATTNNSKEENMIKKTFEVNTIGTMNVLLSSINTNYNLLIYTNTFELYGDENKAPFNEKMKTKGMSPYSTSKICGEDYCELFSEIYNKPVVSFRLPIVYGPGQKGKMFIPDLMKSVKEKRKFTMTKGEQTRDFIFINDVIDAFIMACNKNIKGIFNIGSGEETSMKKVIEIIKKQVNIEVLFEKEYRKNEIWHYYSDISKIKNKLEWKPKTKLEEGLKKTLDWWKNNE